MNPNSQNNVEENHEDILVAQGAVRTYKQDMAQALTGEQGMLVKQEIEKERNRQNFLRSQTLASAVNKVFFLFGIVILLAGIFFTFLSLKKYFTHSDIEFVEPVQPLIFFDNEQRLGDLPKDKNKIIDSIKNAYYTSNEKTNRIVFGTWQNNSVTPVDAKNLFTIIDENLPKKLVVGLNYFFEIGNIGNTEKNNPFIILTLTGTDGSYQGLNEWEKSMAGDLLPIFDYTLASGDPLLFKSFEDGIIENQNVRILKDEFGDPVLMWSIVGTKTVLITQNIDTFKDVLARIHGSNNKNIN